MSRDFNCTKVILEMIQNGAGPLINLNPDFDQIYVHFGDKPYAFLLDMDRYKSLSLGKNKNNNSQGLIRLNSSLF